ncbi:hypothetical protein Dsin_028599 [Dipteronia sinensis]|uniref:Amino acid transporter transmembrane domain-containing protein n=1 Tax=Dipteronia sinensis TaxID=43782 RepID=A0AAE0DUF1_9ROSI|nr:hypothetical protein Dsin_028599 [Dipteronia sinensis]
MRDELACLRKVRFEVCGSIGRLPVDVMIVLTQAGFCISYLIFITNLSVNVINSNESISYKIFGFLTPKPLYILGCFPFKLRLNSIPTLTHLASLSIFADVVNLGAIGVVMVEDVMIFSKHWLILKAFGDFSIFSYGIGVAVYAFEGIGMILPLESETKDQVWESVGIMYGFHFFNLWIIWCIGLLCIRRRDQRHHHHQLRCRIGEHFGADGYV